MSVTPFKIQIADSELDLIQQKLSLTRLDPRLEHATWTEAGQNKVTYQFMRDTIDFWRTKYDWRKEESRLNELPQFTTPIDVEGFETITIHFVHSKTSKSNAIPLLFIHGWPGSFQEVSKVLKPLNDAGFDVVAPSLPGFGFSSSTTKAGFQATHFAQVFDKLMQRLNYPTYVVQGGDWGSFLGRTLAIEHPEHVRALHVNMLITEKPDSIDDTQEYTPFEKARLAHMQNFFDTEHHYAGLQMYKPQTLGFALHDSPAGMLAWMADKLFVWTDSYPWTPTEIITWTLLHWLPGPTTGFAPYREIPPRFQLDDPKNRKVLVPSGASAFPKELGIVPRVWAEKALNVVFWADHPEGGGHFAAYEKPEALSADIIEFFQRVWKGDA